MSHSCLWLLLRLPILKWLLFHIYANRMNVAIIIS